MDFLTTLSLIVGVYCILLFFDLIFKSCSHYPYIKLLEVLGLKVGFFTIKWKTKALNRIVLKWCNARPQFWRLWFLLGIYTSIVFLPISIGILFYSILQIFIEQDVSDTPLLVSPIIPGINLPVSELGYYSVTLLICSIVHELGHAVAAVLEDVGILDLGCNLYFILPVAFVSIPTEKLSTIHLKKRLSIFCAGIWHNLVLTFIAYLIYCSLPSLFSPFFNVQTGVSIIHMNKHSPLIGTNGLTVNDIVTEINDCKINNENDWFQCLNNKHILLPAVCIESDLVHTLDESVPVKHGDNGFVECCDPSNNKNLCFEYVDFENNELELPGHVCLPGRIIMEKMDTFCTIEPHQCRIDSYCFKPILPNNTFVFKIVCKTKNVIYLGHPNDIFQTIEISSYISMTWFLSARFPDVITKFIKYIVILSLGLAFVNILPFIYMDGQYIFQILGLLYLKPRVGKKRNNLIITVITWTFSIITFLYLVYSVLRII